MKPLPPHLLQKIDQSKMVIEQALETYGPEQMLMAWSGGKDSTLVVWLTREVCRDLKLPYPRALDIDEDDPFPEVEQFRDQLAQDWQVPLITVRNADILDKVSNIGDSVAINKLNAVNQAAFAELGYTEPVFQWVSDSPLCSHLLKNIPVRDALVKYGIQAMMTGIRWDEHSSREKETYFSPRENPAHMRVQPILHFTEQDIWDTLFGLDIPFNSLYQLGYRSLGTRSGTHRAGDIPAWQQNLAVSTERGGRSEEKERFMEQLRALGYM